MLARAKHCAKYLLSLLHLILTALTDSYDYLHFVNEEAKTKLVK